MRRKVLIFLFGAIVLSRGIMTIEPLISQWQKEHSGIPDALGGISVNNDHILLVVANSDEIADREEFARTVIDMCRENAFKSMKFSVDRKGYPERLKISVYLHRKNIEKGERLFEILYEPTERFVGYDIKNDPDKFILYVDGQEIEYHAK